MAELDYSLPFAMQGVDIRHNKDRKVRRREPKSQDIYLRLLVKVRSGSVTRGWGPLHTCDSLGAGSHLLELLEVQCF